MLFLLLAALAVHSTFASSCGDSSIPYSFETLADGQPVLGCARPTCFGWNYNGQPASNTASFNMINDHPDGFLRNGPASIPPFSPLDTRYYQQQTATCEETFQSNGCNQDNQWVGGVATQPNVSSSSSGLQCCSFEHLSLSTGRGTASVNAGQIFVGGEVMMNGMQSAFDYISNINKVVSQDGSVSYQVDVRRLPCPPLPTNEIPPPVIQAAQPSQPAQPAPQPVYYPPVQAAAPAYFGGGSYFCFTADTTVRTIDGMDKRMDELQVDDWIQSVNGSNVVFAPVKFWLHRLSNQKAEFRRIELEDGTALKLTDKHYIFKAQCAEENNVNIEDMNREAVFADEVREGDCLYRVLGDDDIVLSRVQKISMVEETGIYAPMTSNGKLVVNGVLASCHNIIQSQTLHNSFFSYIDYFHSLLTSILGTSTDSRELPAGMELVLSMLDYAVPKNIALM